MICDFLCVGQAGFTPLYYAKRYNYLAAIEILETAGGFDDSVAPDPDTGALDLSKEIN